MADYSISIHGVQDILDHTIINPAVRAKLMRRALSVGGEVLRTGVMKRMPVASGQTRSRVTMRIAAGAKDMSAVVGARSRAASGFDIVRGLEEGTGLYGPKHHVIVPTHGKALRWAARKPVSGTRVGGWIFRRSVKGMKPRHMFARTMKEDGPRAREAFMRVIASGLAKGAG